MGDFSIVGALVKVALVFGLLFLTLKGVARVNRNGGGASRALAGIGRGPARPVEVLGRSTLGRNASVVVVRVGTSCLALGVSEHAVNLLSEVEVEADPDTDTPDTHNGDTAPPAGTQLVAHGWSWRDFLESLRDRTVRR